MGGRPQAASLVQGLRPRNAPSKTIPHRPCVLIPAAPLQQLGRRQPNTQSDSLYGGRDKGQVKTGTVYGLGVTTDYQELHFAAPPQRPLWLATVFILPQQIV